MPQGPRVATVFEYEQVTPSTDWTVVHNIGGFPIVDVFTIDNGQLKKMIPKAVKYIDPVTCLIQFSTPTAGFARIA